MTTMCPLILNWEKITDNFKLVFDAVFDAKNRKAHFDNVPEEISTVDGAKHYWCKILFLDAMISILTCDQVRGTRRAFKQQNILLGCILCEIRATDESFFLSRIVLSNGMDNAGVDERSLAVSNLEWTSVGELETYLSLNCPPSKAKCKYPAIVKYLCNHPSLVPYDGGNDLQGIVTAIVNRAMKYDLSHSASASSSRDNSGNTKRKLDNKQSESSMSSLSHDEEEGNSSGCDGTTDCGTAGSTGDCTPRDPPQYNDNDDERVSKKRWTHSYEPVVKIVRSLIAAASASGSPMEGTAVVAAVAAAGDDKMSHSDCTDQAESVQNTQQVTEMHVVPSEPSFQEIQWPSEATEDGDDHVMMVVDQAEFNRREKQLLEDIALDAFFEDIGDYFD